MAVILRAFPPASRGLIILFPFVRGDRLDVGRFTQLDLSANQRKRLEPRTWEYPYAKIPWGGR
jgi:hypothetical protein